VKHNINWKKELTVFAVLFACGILLLPAAIYFVGTSVVGEYKPDGEVFDLWLALLSDLAVLRPPAWLLVLSPYIVIQLLRVSRKQWRGHTPAQESIEES